jgi:hypothetical protein
MAWSSIIMPKSNCPEPQTLKSDKIEIDTLTLKKLALLVGQSLYNLQSSRDCDILLTSLDNYLGESSNPEEARKSSLLLNMYRDVVPERLEETETWLTEATEQLAFILAASNLGAANTRGSHDDE